MSVTLGEPAEYSRLAKWFHWVTVLLIAVALSVGPMIKFIKDDDKLAFYAIHESAGLTLLIVVLLRLLWRLFNRPPPMDGRIPPVLRRTADGVHHALYALLVIQPVVGFFMTNAFGFPMAGKTAYLGVFDLPKFMQPAEGLANGLKLVHVLGGYSILVLLVLHIGGVVWHQAIRRDGTLLRMV